MHGKAMGQPLWLPFCWANSPNCSFPISHSLDGTLFVSLHFILTGEDCSQGQWANSPEKSQLSPAVPRRTSIFISAPSCQRIGEFMSGSWINCFKPWGRRRRFYHQMFSKMFPSKLCSHPLFPAPPTPTPTPTPTIASLEPSNIWYLLRTGRVSATQTVRLVVVTAQWRKLQWAAARLSRIWWNEGKQRTFARVPFGFPLSITVDAGAKLGNDTDALTDVSINRICSDIWWPEL